MDKTICLPNDIIKTILLFIDHTKLMKIRLVGTVWNQLIKSIIIETTPNLTMEQCIIRSEYYYFVIVYFNEILINKIVPDEYCKNLSVVIKDKLFMKCFNVKEITQTKSITGIRYNTLISDSEIQTSENIFYQKSITLNKLEVVEFLLEKDDIGTSINDYKDAIIRCATHNHHQMLKLILDKYHQHWGLEYYNDNDTKTKALDIAKKSGFTEIINLLSDNKSKKRSLDNSTDERPTKFICGKIDK
jgi:hypothetical protein